MIVLVVIVVVIFVLIVVIVLVIIVVFLILWHRYAPPWIKSIYIINRKFGKYTNQMKFIEIDNS